MMYVCVAVGRLGMGDAVIHLVFFDPKVAWRDRDSCYVIIVVVP